MLAIRQISLWILMLSSITFMVACEQEKNSDQPKTRQELMDSKLNERLEKHKKEKIEKCRQRTIERAESFVHEKMIARIRKLMKDTIAFPEKPVRPPLPENLHLDTIGVKQIGDFELEKSKVKK